VTCARCWESSATGAATCRRRGLPLSLLAELKDQIPCDELDFDGHDAGRQIYGFSQAVPRDDGSGFDFQLYWKLYWDSVCSSPTAPAMCAA
jgi:hypothetical protein